MASELSTIVRTAFDDACKHFTERIAPLGFSQGRKRTWYRLHEYTADFIYLHRSGSSYGAPISAQIEFDVHMNIRVLNSPEHLVLSVPRNTPDLTRKGRYHLRFNAESGALLDRCIDDFERFVKEIGEPWFARFREPNTLLRDADSPLTDTARKMLQEHLGGRLEATNIEKSYNELGIKGKRGTQRISRD